MARKRPKPNKKDVRAGRREYTVHDPAQEREAAAAWEWLNQVKKAGKPASIRTAAQRFGVKYHILRSRYQGTHKPLWQARAEQQILSPTQEDTVKEWISYLGAMGLPLGVSELRRVIDVVAERRPSK